MNVLSEFATTLTLASNEITMPATVSVNNAGYVNVAETKVPAKQIRTFGAGRIVSGVDNRRTTKIKFYDDSSTPENVKGTVRFMVADANKQNLRFVDEYRTEDINDGLKIGKGGDEGNRENILAKSQDGFLIVQFKPDEATKTIVKDNSELFLAQTVWTLED
ncbi:MAG: hypothetical protein ACOC1P_00600 [Minisyncoccales bacterium]